MNNDMYISRNGLKRVSPASPAPAWPPPWLSGPPVATVAAPVESLAGPCPTCGCAIGWRLPAGQVLCAACDSRPDAATKAVYADDGRGWVDYTAERERHERRHEAADDSRSWDDAESWTAETWHCPKCGSAASWESLADVRHCLTCEPPWRAMRLQREAARKRRRFAVADGRKDNQQTKPISPRVLEAG